MSNLYPYTYLTTSDALVNLIAHLEKMIPAVSSFSLNELEHRWNVATYATVGKHFESREQGIKELTTLLKSQLAAARRHLKTLTKG
jgi:hypothetical protein